VQEPVGRAVEADEGKGERPIEWMLRGRLGHPRPRLDRAGRAHLDQIRAEVGTGRRIPLHRRRDHLIAIADAEDSLVGQRRHEGSDHRTQRAFVGECDRALDEPRHRVLAPSSRRADD
jgi:hypothetical protein